MTSGGTGGVTKSRFTLTWIRHVMSKLRRAVVWWVLYTQIWTPVLAQTLPIRVDHAVAGQKPVVGVANGVPVVNIAPPSAGGVSNNRFTQFNVGSSGVVLNNSGAASQTQVAGQVAGNPMLGNQRAAIILNQVTAPHPSQLRGMLEVAGNRANVIVANPAGITCNGCGFLNASRATLTTGKPVVGPGGALGFDIAGGRLGIDGAGLYGANLSQLDLMARTLELNAQVSANTLNVVAGAARVGYDAIDVSALSGVQTGTGVALDVAALGGMYANSIRLIGTQAGVGVNIGGNLTALTGTLTVDTRGEVHILPSAHLQAATDLSLNSGGDIINDGTVVAGSALGLNAAARIANHNAMSSAGNTYIVARRLENHGALTAGLQANGALSTLGTLSAQVDELLNPDTLVAGGDARITAHALALSGGMLAASGALAVDATGGVTNRAGEVYGGSVMLRAAGLDNTGGRLTSGGVLSARMAGALVNTGGTLAGAGALDLSAPSVVNAAGGVVSGHRVALQGADGIDNQGGLVQANDSLRVQTAGALTNQGGSLYGGALGIEAANLANRGGKVVSGGTLDFTATGTGTGTGTIDNRSGTIAAQGQATLNAQSLSNTRGIITAGDLTLKTQGMVHNSAGLIQSDDVLALTAGQVNNRDTLANGVTAAEGTTAGDLGLMGRHVTLVAGSVDNEGGRIGAGQDLTLSTGALDNTHGNVSSKANAKLAFSHLTNSGGVLSPGHTLALVTGTLDNDGKIHAGQDLTITADTLIQRAAGELIAGRNTELNIGAMLANAGLIDGGHVRIGAGTLRNTGRIYGGRIAIRTALLHNEPNAVIASRGDLDLGVGTLTNRAHALIYAGADLRVGRTLDAGEQARGQAQSLVNESATIEAGRNADMAGASIQNRNLHFADATVEVSREPKWFYRLSGTTEIVDGQGMWFCNTVKSICGRTPDWMGPYEERRLLMPSSRYPESRYGPPFDYSNIQKDQQGRAGVGAPIGLAYIAEHEGCTGGDADNCSTIAAQFRYPPDARIWSVFKVERPSGIKRPPSPADCGYPCPADLAEKQAAYEHDLQLYDTLNRKIKDFNADFRNHRMIKDFTFYEVTEIARETRVTQSDPGRIIVGGDAHLSGNIVNDTSRILAGGTLKTEGGTLENVGAQGMRTVERVGTMAYTYEKHDSRKYNRSDYNATVLAEHIETGLGAAQGNTAVATSAQRPGASRITQALAPASLTRITLPGNHSIVVVVVPPVIPSSALYRVMQAPDAPYLIATDRAFIGLHPAVSSDLLLRQLHQNPNTLPKRLGDGFYEQRLVAEQIMLASGQRFVGHYTDQDSQYKGLLTAGAEFAVTLGLTAGVALTEEQMRNLSSDIVWLVEQTVTLPDGTLQKVLTSQVYLAVKPGDQRGDGTLIAGRDTQISTTGDVNNSGTIGARNVLVVDAHNVRHAVGTIQGKRVNLKARNDIANLAGLLKGDAVVLTAGRDIDLTASTQSNERGGIRNTIVDGVARVDAGTFDAQAGRDFNAQAAAVATRDEAALRAGNDINLTAVGTGYAESHDFGNQNRAQMRMTDDVGTQIGAGGNLTLTAGRDVQAIAAQVASDQQLGVGAGRDLDVQAGNASGYAYNEIHYKTRGFLSSKTTHRIKEASWTQAVPSTFTGDSAVLMAGRDVSVAGSNVGAQNDLVMSGARDVDIVAGANTSAHHDYAYVKKSGFGALGGLSLGSRKETDILDGDQVLHSAATVGSVQGDTLIDAGTSLNVVGSNLLARQGDITLIGRDVNITALTDSAREQAFHEVKQTGLSINASTPVVSAMQTAGRMAEAGGKTDNTVMQRLTLATTGLAAVNAYDAVMDAKDMAGGVNVGIDLGTSESQSRIKRDSTSVSGSHVAAGHDLTLVANGADKDADVTVTGSRLSAGHNAVIKADGDIVLQAAQNTFEQHSTHKRTSSSIGVGMTAGKDGLGVMINAAASGARGHADGKDVNGTYTNVTAGNILALQSGGDTSLVGAVGQAEQIIASVGQNLRIETQQDTRTSQSREQGAGVNASLCVYGACRSSVSANVSQGKMNSEFKSAREQAGLKAGDGGFIVDVRHNTTLIGGVIASGDQAVVDGLNQLRTGTLVVQDLKNSARYNASQVAVGGGMGFGEGDAKAGSTGQGTTKDNQVAGGSKAEAGTSVTSSGGVGMGVPVVAAASGSANSTTSAAISGGTLLIGDEEGQKALTGKTVAQTIASLNRDTSSDTLNRLGPIFDKEKIEAGFSIASEVTRQVGQFLTNRAKEIDALEAQSKDPALSPQARDAAAISAIQLRRDWGPAGKYRQVLTAMSAGAGGNVMGGVGTFAQSAAVHYLQALATEKVKTLADSFGQGPEAEAIRASLHAIVGCAGAAASGSGACGAGALGASTSSVLNALLTRANSDGLSAEDKETYNRLLTSVVAAAGLGVGEDVVSVVVAARTETENNYLKASEAKEMMDALLLCRAAPDAGACRAEVQDKYQTINEGRGGSRMYACKSVGESACHAQRSDVEGGSQALEVFEGLGWNADEYAVLDSLLAINLNDERIAHHAWLQTFYQEAGAPVPIGVGIAVGRAIRAEAAAARAEALVGKAGLDQEIRAGGRSVGARTVTVDPATGAAGASGGAQAPVASISHISGVSLSKSRSKMMADFEAAGYPAKPVVSPTSGNVVGTQYILPDGSRVRVMQADGRSPQRASFENANGGPVDPTTGKPPQPPQGLSKAERKQWIRERTHIEQVD